MDFIKSDRDHNLYGKLSAEDLALVVHKKAEDVWNDAAGNLQSRHWLKPRDKFLDEAIEAMRVYGISQAGYSAFRDF